MGPPAIAPGEVEMELSTIASLARLAQLTGARKVASTVLGLEHGADGPVASDPDISLRDLGRAIDAEAEQLDGIKVSPCSATDVSASVVPSWQEIARRFKALSWRSWYPTVIAAMVLCMVGLTMSGVVARTPVSIPILVASICGVASYCFDLVTLLHRNTAEASFSPTQRLGLWGIVGALLVAGGHELYQQLADVGLAGWTAGRALALGIPVGMLELAWVVQTVRRDGANGQHRRRAILGWVSIAVGCLGTILITGRVVGNMILIVLCLFAAQVASSREQ